MLIYVQAFILAFIGCIATNIDNILLVLSSGSPQKARQSALVFVVILVTYILLALVMSYGVDLTIPRFIVWLGLIPFSIGLYELRPWRKTNEDGSKMATISITALGITLAINSLDTLIVQLVMFSDFATAYHTAGLAGATTAAAILGLTAFGLLKHPASAKRLLPFAAKARPWILIAVGLLILMDSGFDTQ
jgi:cadmium resistance protein CadD (predicted permease)